MRQKVFLLISFIWSGVSLIRVSVPRRYCSILSAVNIKTKPIEISIGQKRIDFKSRVYRFVKTEATSNAVVDLYALLHVGESAYFSDIEKQLNAYDLVLYELITSVNNTDKVFGEFRLLNKDIVAVKTEMLASAFNFKTQLDMDLRKQNWYYIYLSLSFYYFQLKSLNKHILLFIGLLLILTQRLLEGSKPEGAASRSVATNSVNPWVERTRLHPFF
jgi:hypothetical protein